MGDVVQLKRSEPEQAADPHLAGQARCLACGYEWVAVAPIGTREFECSQCHTNKGVMKNTVVVGSSVFTCYCGGELFRIDRRGPYCIECGYFAMGWF